MSDRCRYRDRRTKEQCQRSPYVGETPTGIPTWLWSSPVGGADVETLPELRRDDEPADATCPAHRGDAWNCAVEVEHLDRARRRAGVRFTANGKVARLPPALRDDMSSPPVAPSAELDADRPSAALISTSWQSAKACQRKAVLVACNHRYRLVEGGYGARDCVRCRGDVTRERALRVTKKLTAGRQGRSPWLCTVFTVPPSLRAHYAAHPAEWKTVAREAWGILRDFFGGRFAVESTHPVGDEHLSTFHPHLNFIWAQHGGWRAKLDVCELNEAWASVLNAPPLLHGKRCQRCNRKHRVDLHHAFTDDIRELAHHVRYNVRTWAGWGEWLPSVRWFGAYPRNVDMTLRCDDCDSPFRILGFGRTAVALFQAHGAHLPDPTGPPRAEPECEDDRIEFRPNIVAASPQREMH